MTHVGLNAHLLSLEENYRGAGISWYIYNLLTHLPDAAPELRYTAFTHESRFTPRQGMRVRRPAWPTASPLGRIAWEQFVAPIVVQRERIDVLHAMAFVSPVLSPCPSVVTVLDLSFLHYPSAFKPGKRLYLRWMTALSARRARRVVAISESTRRDVIAHLHVAPAHVHTVHCGVDPRFAPLPAAALADFRRRKGLPARFVLFLGTIEPRKNVAMLIDAFARLVGADPAATADLHLVIAGARGWYANDVYARAEASGIADRVHFPGYVPEEEKALWYGAATCFCYPSLYEGFGLPPLEAMACGVPVITSDRSSLPEVVGDGGLTVPPDDGAALSAALWRVITEPALRDELGQRGPARAARFTWTEAARQTVDVYRQALKGD
ncbi:MAG: glycosyltransferase family 4 protein [Anaerolineae bacterium]|nr:glycosyltransferase family 4 protein [Anaerolineae bacterium]